MSFNAVNWAIQQPLKDAKEKMLLVVLAYHLNGKTGKCCPSRDTLMTMACIANKATLTAKLSALVEKGLIEITHGNGVSNQYRFLVEFASEPGSVVNQVQDCTRFSSEPRTRFSSEPAPGSAVNHEQGRNKELNKDIRLTAVSAPSSKPESAVETGMVAKKAEKKPSVSVTVSRPEEVTKESWDAWMQVRKAKKSPPLNPIAWRRFQREAQKAGMTLQQVITLCAEKEWRGFEAGWLKRDDSSFGASAPAQQAGGSLFGSFSK